MNGGDSRITSLLMAASGLTTQPITCTEVLIQDDMCAEGDPLSEGGSGQGG